MPPRRGLVPDDLWRLRAVSDPQVSPDGRGVAFVVATPDPDTDKAATAIWVAPADASTPARAFTNGPQDNSPRWSADGRWLAFVAQRGDAAQLHVASLDGGEARPLTNMAFGVSQPVWSPDSRHLAFVAATGEWKKPDERNAVERAAPRVVTGLAHRYDGVGDFDARRSHLFVVGIGGGAPSQITDGDYDDTDPDWSPDGRQLAFVSDRSDTRFDETHRDVWVVALNNVSRPRRVTRGRGTAGSPRWSPDSTTIAYIGHEHHDGDLAANTELLVVAARRPGPPRSLSAALDRSVWGLIRAPGATHAWVDHGSAVIFTVADHGSLSVWRGGLDASAPAVILGGDRQIAALHASAGTVAFVSQWPSAPPEVFCAGVDGTAQRQISNANAELAARRWAPVHRRAHVAPDGRRIESFVLYPAGLKNRRPAPTVLEIHGGPHGWHPQMSMLGLYQSLAAAGYVVILPNPRGSHGYGEAHSRACVGDWGGGDFDDLMGAVDQLVDAGVADPERLYVAGYSYGGYLTSWTVGHTDRFAAACVSAPVTDLVSMWGTTDIPNFLAAELGGAPWERADHYGERSPITYVANVRTPVQLFHWEGDLRCPIGQTDELFQGLRRLGREVVMVRYPGGFHIVRSPSQMVDYVARHLSWFAQHPTLASSGSDRRQAAR